MEEDEVKKSCWFQEKIKLLKPEGYENRYYQFIRQGFTPMIAWKKTETEKVEFFNVSGYSSYKSFRVSLNKKKRNQVSRKGN